MNTLLLMCSCFLMDMVHLRSILASHLATQIKVHQMAARPPVEVGQLVDGMFLLHPRAVYRRH